MAFCPNKNLRAWIDLEIAQPERSYQLWDEYKGNVPSKYYNVKPLLDKVKKELKFRSPLFTSELILLKSRLKDYNTKNGTSHKLNITKIGESDRHKVDLYLDYTPVNEEMRREREAIRSEEGKSFYNIEETNKEDIVNPLIEEARRIQLEDAKRAGIDYDDRYLFNQTIGIKPGVAKLFESNPELANAVYEALGFKTKPDVILPIGTSGSGKSTFIKSLPQENLVVIEPDAMRVEFTGDMNNKSKDKEIYEEAAKRAIAAIKQGKQVVFDTTNLTKEKRLPFIKAIKEAIPTANIQYKLMELNPELAKQRIKAQLARGENRAAVSDETIDRHAASYRQMLEDIKDEPISNFEITPQQKQQAQQLYSQYLDTVSNLYRSEDDTSMDKPAPDWVKESDEYKATEEAKGRWFYSTLEEAIEHSKKFGSSGISYIKVNDIKQFNAKENKFAGGYGKQGNEYFVTKELGKNRVKLGSNQDIDNFANFVSYENSSYSKIGSIQQFRDYIMSKNFAAVEEFLVVNNKIDRKC